MLSSKAEPGEVNIGILFNTIISAVLGYVGGMIGFVFLSSIYSLVVLIPSIAVGIRRMHDVGKSGWSILIPIYNLILACTAGEKGENLYGQDPKEDNGFTSPALDSNVK